MRFAAVALICLCLASSANAALTINEIRIDEPGADNSEYFELYADMNFADLSNFYYLVIGDGSGGSGTVENVTQLTGSLSSGGFLLVAEATFALSGTPNIVTTLNFENSDNVTHVLVEGFTGADGDDLDTNDDGILDVTPWTSVLDAVSLIETTNVPADGEYFYATELGGTVVGPDGTFVPGHVFRDIDGTGAFQIGQFDPVGGFDTPGFSNVPEPGAGAFLIGSMLFWRLRRTRS